MPSPPTTRTLGGGSGFVGANTTGPGQIPLTGPKPREISQLWPFRASGSQLIGRGPKATPRPPRGGIVRRFVSATDPCGGRYGDMSDLGTQRKMARRVTGPSLAPLYWHGVALSCDL